MGEKDAKAAGGVRRVARGLALAAAVAAATGCSLMPTAGPSVSAIESSSIETATPSFALVRVDPSVIATLAERTERTLSATMRGQSTPARRVIGVGDLVNVTIWESASGGLFSGSGDTSITGGATAGANSVTIPPQRVDASGRITVPYAGSIRAAGRRPDQVAQQVIAALQGRAIEPQALVTVNESISNQATVIGDAVGGSRVPLIGKDERLLDVIASAGGVTAPIYSVSVRLTRGERTAESPLHRVIVDPEENIVMQAGDVVTLFKNPETFTAFGATGQSTLASFDDEMLMLDEALAKVGGVIDTRGDPAGIFIFRYEPAALAAALGGLSIDTAEYGPGAVVPVAYQIDLSRAEGFFYARNFRMRNKDIVFVANAEATELEKVLSLIGAVFAPVGQGIGTANAVSSLGSL